MNPRSAIQKGKELENYVAQQLVVKGIDRQATRQIGSGNGRAKGDIQTSCGWTIECKNTKSFQWRAAAEQVKREGMGYQREMIVWHPPQRPLGDSIAIVDLDVLLELIASYERNKGATEILDKYQIKNNLDRAIHHLKQVVKDL